MSISRYEQRGVSAKKEEVHAAIKDLDKGLFPNAFCKVLPDITGGDPAYCNVMHADTAGTKTALAYLYWKETANLDIWRGVVQDAIVMNIDDMACVGITDNIILSSTVGRNKHHIPGDVITAIIKGTTAFIEKMKDHGIHIKLAGGETADVGDVVRTVDIGFTTFARTQQSNILENNIQPGDVIVGLASDGQSTYEDAYNSGIGSNGLTSGRHDVLDKYYFKKYPESFDPNTPQELAYSGSKRLTETEPETGIAIGDLLLAPTRTYLPVLRQLFKEMKDKMHGVIHCTGGGQTKVLHFINDVRVIKDNLFSTPPVFRLMQSESGTEWKEMYQVFNMGHRLEVYLPKESAQQVIDIAGQYNINAQIIGHCEIMNGEEVQIAGDKGIFIYR